MIALQECLAHLTDVELDRVMDLRSGFATVSKFLPTPADIHAFLKTERNRAEQFKSPHTYHQRFPSVCTPADLVPKRYAGPLPKLTEAFRHEPELLLRKFDTLFCAERALTVTGVDAARAVLIRPDSGDNPEKPQRPDPEVPADGSPVHLDLQSPIAPISDQLRELLVAQGYCFPSEFPPTKEAAE